MTSFNWPPRGGAIQKVADQAARLALYPEDGDVVIQLDNDTLYAYDATTMQWLVAGGKGTVIGPISSTDNAIARYDGTTGTLIQNSSVIISDAGLISVPTLMGLENTVLGSTLNLGTSDNTVSMNVGTGTNLTTLNIGAGVGPATINIGAAGDTVNIYGSLVTVDTTNLSVTDKNIQLNNAAIGTGTARGAGINIRDNNVDSQAYVRVDGSTGTTWQLKAPESSGIVTLDPGSLAININQNISTISSPTFAGLILTSFNGFLKATSGVVATSLIVNTDIDASAAIAYSKLNLLDSIIDADIHSTAAISYSKLALTNSIVNADISTAAAIAYSKLALTNSIVNADIAPSAAIAYSKLSLATSIVNADISASAAIVYSKLVLTNSVVDADIATTAAIARTKLASGTANYVVINDGTGVLSSEAFLDRTRGGTGITSTATFPASGVIVTESSRVVTAARVDSTTTITVLTTDYAIKCTNVAARAVALPVAPPNGFEILIKDGARNASSANITITAGSGATIEGNATLLMESDNSAVKLKYFSTGTIWEQI